MNTTPQEPGVLEKLPNDLHYLIEPAIRFACRTEWDAFAHLSNASSQDLQLLSTIARRVLENDHYPIVIQFLDKYPMTKFDESAQLYFFFGLLDHSGLNFDR